MFAIGEKISYPMHGAGIIVGVEEQFILDVKRKYYILKLSYGDMKVMVPVDTTKEAGVRNIVDVSQLEEVFDVLAAESTSMPENWNKRSRYNMDKLKSGDLKNVAEVVRNLMRSEMRKRLSTGEKKMLNNARHLLISEIVLVREISADEAERLVDDAVSRLKE